MELVSLNRAEQLLEELKKERKNIKTDSYNMSIGEIINLYEDNELKLNPAFQRLFRWDDYQKTNFIESILLGIPIPEIFVAQKADGKWDIVDGVQRISTLLQLTGKLEGYDPLILTETTYLPSLEGFDWDKLPDEVKRILRRGKLGINIILTENSIKSQYELFQRLNTGGLHLEDQEIRNCLLIMVNNEFYEAIEELKNYSSFRNILSISEEKFKKEYHMELIVRYLIGKINNVNYDEYNENKDKLAHFFDQEITRIISDENFNLEKEIETFKKSFDLLERVLNIEAFKKYNSEKDRFEGPFSITSFEAITPGIAENIEELYEIPDEEFKELIINLYNQEEYKQFSSRGVKAMTRFKGLTKFSKEYFKR